MTDQNRIKGSNSAVLSKSFRALLLIFLGIIIVLGGVTDLLVAREKIILNLILNGVSLLLFAACLVLAEVLSALEGRVILQKIAEESPSVKEDPNFQKRKRLVFFRRGMGGVQFLLLLSKLLLSVFYYEYAQQSAIDEMLLIDTLNYAFSAVYYVAIFLFGFLSAKIEKIDDFYIAKSK